MKAWIDVLVAYILLYLLAGCSANRVNQDLISPSPPNRDPVVTEPANRELIVLLPDPDGKVGTLQVTTQEGSQVVDKRGYATRVDDGSKLPTIPKAVNESEVTGIFGAALSAQPDLTGRFVSFRLYFERNSTKLTHESNALLLEVIGTIRNRNPDEVYVVGHSDRVGTEVYNTRLSSRRANHVRDLLVSGGIQSGLFVVSFHGEGMPAVSTEDEVAEPLNRRVEVIVR